MADKCWCGKELEQRIDVSGATWYVCPLHGMGWRWRPCEFAYGEETRSSRGCGANGMQGMVMPKHCIGCELPDDHRDAKKWRECGPALVDAVRAVSDPAEWLQGSVLARPTACVFCDASSEGAIPQNIMHSEDCPVPKAQAALAALEQAKGEEHDG